MRNHSFLGSAQISTSFPVPRQTYAATDFDLPLLQSYSVRTTGELLAIQQRNTDEPWKQWDKQNQSVNM